MGLVVWISRQSLAVSAEVSVVANGTLVAIAPNKALRAGAEWSVAEDTAMMLPQSWHIGQRFVERCETMTRMRGLSIRKAGRAVVKVWASKALVAHTNDLLFNVSSRCLSNGAVRLTLLQPSQVAWWT